MKKLVIAFFIILIFATSCSFAVEVTCEKAILIEANTGKILYEKYASEKAFPASTTKVLTAILALEKLKLEDTLTASENAINSVPSGGSTAGIVAGETLSVEYLLESLLIASANEAANVLAEGISGNIDDFVSLMNTRAQELGLKNTHFINTNGLHDDNHYSCANDLVILYKYAWDNFEDFRRIVAMKRFTLPATEKHNKEDRIHSNSNQLIIDGSQYYYAYCTGGKTGYTSEAKNCLVASATKDNVSLILCVLGADKNDAGESQRYIDAKTLFDYGFERLVSKTFVFGRDIYDSIEIENAKDDVLLKILYSEPLILTIEREDSEKVFAPTITLKENLSAPIMSGDVVGKASFTINDNTYEQDLIAGNDIEKDPFGPILDILANILLIIFRIFVILAIIILILRFYNKVIRKKSRRRSSSRARRYNARFHK